MNNLICSDCGKKFTIEHEIDPDGLPLCDTCFEKMFKIAHL